VAIGLRLRNVAAILAAVVLALALAYGVMVRGAQPAQAANNCQPFSHYHYHFPTAHNDYWHYHGSWNDGTGHFHSYHNHTHGLSYFPQCPRHSV
jgi:hypothetical protein